MLRSCSRALPAAELSAFFLASFVLLLAAGGSHQQPSKQKQGREGSQPASQPRKSIERAKQKFHRLFGPRLNIKNMGGVSPLVWWRRRRWRRWFAAVVWSVIRTHHFFAAVIVVIVAGSGGDAS